MSSQKVKYLGIEIDYSRDKIIPEQGIAMLTAPGMYKNEHEESPQETFARAATCYSFGDYAFAQRIYDYVSQQDFMYASPVCSNAVEVNWPEFGEHQFKEAGDWLQANVTPEGMPISCFLSVIEDSKAGLTVTDSEAKELSMAGGGVGILMANRSPDEKSTGIMQHAAVYDAVVGAYRQRATRRGSAAVYADITHPEIRQFIHMRDPTSGGVDGKKCFDLNNAVNIPDSFMEAVIKGESVELVDPKHGRTGRMEDARALWKDIMQVRKDTGEPYMLFIDTCNRNLPKQITNPRYKVRQSNLCVAPETMVLTDKGNFPIENLAGQSVNVWNGQEWSEVEVVQTGSNQKLVTVTTDFGQTMDCTEYHKFYTQADYKGTIVEKRAAELKPGDKLIKFDLPVIEGSLTLEKAYTNGFFTGDGFTSTKTGHNHIYLYHEKRKLAHLMEGIIGWNHNENTNRQQSRAVGLKHKFFVPDATYTIQSRLEWFAGWVDADGTIARNGTNHSLQAASIEFEFLREVQFMLQTLGVVSKIQELREEGVYQLPANDGTGEFKGFNCQTAYRLLVSSNGLYKLAVLGFKTNRLTWDKRLPQREAERFVTIKSVEDKGRYDDTYCFTEHKRGMGVFGGILTGQCSEITLYTSFKRTAVCCLSSVNVERYDHWKDTQLIADLTRLLDNVLEYFVRLAPPSLSRAVYSAKKERAVGIGAMGWHSYFMSKGIPYESGGFNSAIQHINMIQKNMHKAAHAESLRLGALRGEPEDVEGSGYRNSHLFATAPNASSSSMLDVSPAGEPWAGLCFNAQGRAGSFLIKNKHFKACLQKYGKDTDEVWDQVVEDTGSCQNLDFMSEHDKEVFKTLRDISPMWIIEHASVKQPYICQSQSVNIHVPADISLPEMTAIHMKAWQAGLKSLYYCRSATALNVKIGNGRDAPLNARAVRKTIEFDTNECISCEG